MQEIGVNRAESETGAGLKAIDSSNTQLPFAPGVSAFADYSLLIKTVTIVEYARPRAPRACLMHDADLTSLNSCNYKPNMPSGS